MLPRVRLLLLVSLLSATEEPVRLPVGWAAERTGHAVVMHGPQGLRVGLVESALPPQQGEREIEALARAELDQHATIDEWRADGARAIGGMRWQRFRCRRVVGSGWQLVGLWVHLDRGRLLVASTSGTSLGNAELSAVETVLAGCASSRPIVE